VVRFGYALSGEEHRPAELRPGLERIAWRATEREPAAV
jgi:hypothetical protein